MAMKSWGGLESINISSGVPIDYIFPAIREYCVQHSVHGSEHEGFEECAHFLGTFRGGEHLSQLHYGYVT
ncbi:hypothetical protein glysoja_012620 [Glycine soja]|nr:hypothetical protein glysoja_012620 [Glycine soja]